MGVTILSTKIYQGITSVKEKIFGESYKWNSLLRINLNKNCHLKFTKRKPN